MRVVELPKLKMYSFTKDGLDTHKEEVDKYLSVQVFFKTHGYCYVRILSGDYTGSIARFTPDQEEIDAPMQRRTLSGNYNLKHYWGGRISFEGKRNNPKFGVANRSCEVILEKYCETVFCRRDFKKEGEELLQQDVYDCDGVALKVGDPVLYMNLRYGCGGKLCKGTVKSFKPNVRQEHLSVIVRRGCSEEESELHYPKNQIYSLK